MAFYRSIRPQPRATLIRVMLFLTEHTDDHHYPIGWRVFRIWWSAFPLSPKFRRRRRCMRTTHVPPLCSFWLSLHFLDSHYGWLQCSWRSRVQRVQCSWHCRLQCSWRSRLQCSRLQCSWPQCSRPQCSRPWCWYEPFSYTSPSNSNFCQYGIKADALTVIGARSECFTCS